MLIHAFNGIHLGILNTFFHQYGKSPDVCKEMQMVTISSMISSESFKVLFSLYLKVSIPALQI